MAASGPEPGPGSSASIPTERRAARICINLREDTHDDLRAIAQEEGRSLSNLCAHLLEQMLEQLKGSR